MTTIKATRFPREVIRNFTDTGTPGHIIDALLALQVSSIPITKGTIEYTDTCSIVVTDDTLEGALEKLRQIFGGHMWIDTNNALQWKQVRGNDVGQQIRYRKNLKGITRTIDYSDFANKVYAYGSGAWGSRLTLASIILTPLLGDFPTWSSGGLIYINSGGKYYANSPPNPSNAWVFQNGYGFLGTKYYEGMLDWSVGQFGLMFPSVAIPAGSTIDAAYLYVYASNNEGSDINTLIKGEDAGNATPFSGATSNDLLLDYNSRTLTTASVAWDINTSWGNNQYHKSPDIKTIIQEIVDRGDWVSGNNIRVFWVDNSSGADSYVFLGNAYKHYLTIQFTPPDPQEYVEDLGSQSLYGIKARVISDKSIDSTGSLSQWAAKELQEHSNPKITYKIDIVGAEGMWQK